MPVAPHGRSYQRAAIRTYIGLLFLTVCGFAIMYAPQPMFNTLSAALSVDKASVGLLVSVFMLSLAISPLCIGMILGRIGMKRAIWGASLLFGITGFGFLVAPNFGTVFAIRCVEALLMPLLLTAIMTCIAGLFRHLDLRRAMAGYITCTLLGALCGRILGGISAQVFGWRETLTGCCVFFFLALLCVRGLPDAKQANVKVHSIKEYLTVFSQKGVPSLIFVEACGIFVFAAVGNLLAFRMAELGHGNSEGIIGVMYAGYAAGLFVSMAIQPMMRFFKKATRMLVAGSLIYVFAVSVLLVPFVWALFLSLWFIAVGEFMIHAIAPSMVNRVATSSGKCERSMVNGLFLSCYYIGGVIGSYVPGLLYARFGWIACYACVQTVQVLALLVLLHLRKRMPDLE